MPKINEIKENIKFKRTVQFFGRNGIFKSTGLSILSTYHTEDIDDILRIYPITSKGLMGRGFIDIPFESINDVIKILLKVRAIGDMNTPTKETKTIYF